MTTRIEISQESVRLAQGRIRSSGVSLNEELSRQIVQEQVMELDFELNLLIDEGEAYADNEPLRQALGVNDVVINGRHIDVRPVDTDGNAIIQRALIHTSYLDNGSLLVNFDTAFGGSVVGFMSASDWQSVDLQNKEDGSVVTIANVKTSDDFDLGACLSKVVNAQSKQPTINFNLPDKPEMVRFASCRSEMPLTRQRQIAEAVLVDDGTKGQFCDISMLWGDGSLARILCAQSVWNARVEEFAQKVAPKFSHLSKSEIKNTLMRMGEVWGGQIRSPGFRKAALVALSREELVRRIPTVNLSKVAHLVDKMFSGSQAKDVISELGANKLSLDIAGAIKSQRQKLEGFVSATSEEIAKAFEQLALQPAYATHSDSEAAIETVDENLKLLEAGDIVEEFKELEEELMEA